MENPSVLICYCAVRGQRPAAHSRPRPEVQGINTVARGPHSEASLGGAGRSPYSRDRPC